MPFRKMFLYWMIATVFVATWIAPPAARGEAAWVWHGGNREPSHPGRTDPVTVWVKIGYQFWVDNVVLYYTSDGSEPQGSFGTGSGATRPVAMVWDHLEWDEAAGMYADWWRGETAPAELGTRIRYKIGAWHSGGGQERFADNNATASAEADCFEYTVKGDVRQMRIGDSAAVAATVLIPGVTDPPGPTSGLDAELWTNYSESGPADWHGIPLTYTGDDGDADVFQLTLTPGTPGIYSYLVRYRLNSGDWTYQGDPGNIRSMNRLNVDPAWPEDVVLYQVFPRVHNAADTDSDGNLSNEEFGGFAEVTADIPRIASLGFGAVWLMPLHPLSTDPALIKSSDGLFGSPYAPKDYLAVNPDYGSEADLQALVDAAHNAGLKVLMGFVPNHLSPDNVLLDPANPPEHGGYHPDWFMTDGEGHPIPDDPDWWDTVALDYDCADAADMRRFVTDALAYWLDTLGFDGYRCDMASLQPVDFWEDALAELKTRFPDRIFIAEAYHLDYDLERAGFSCVYDYTLYRSLFNEVRAGTLTAAALAERLEAVSSTDHVAGRLPLLYVENHDEERVAAAFGDASPELNRLILCLKGVPMFYGGQEAGLDRRVPLYRGWNDVETYPFLDFQADPQRTAKLRAFIAYRNQSEALRRGDQTFADCTSEHILAVARRNGDERVLAGFNLDLAGGLRRAGTVTLPDSWELSPDTTYRFQEIGGSDHFRVRGGAGTTVFMDLPARSCRIYQVNEACAWGGDTDGDGDIDTDDDLLTLQAAAGLLNLSAEEDCRGDIDLSGEADVADVIVRRSPSGATGQAVTARPDDVFGMPGAIVGVSLRLESGVTAGAALELRSEPPLEPVSWQPGDALAGPLGAAGIDPCPAGRSCLSPDPGVVTTALVVDTSATGGDVWLRIRWRIPADADWGTVYTLQCQGEWLDAAGHVLSGSVCSSGTITVGTSCDVTGVTLYLPDAYLSPGDRFRLDALICNTGSAMHAVPFFCLLGVGGEYWYYPSWSSDPDWRELDVPAGRSVVSVFEPFTWPEVDGSMDGLIFLSALVSPSMTELIGEPGMVTFGYGPASD